MRVVVVGAGVIGLSAAVRLAESGHDVHVLARDLPLETTSAVAAALWYPYRASPPEAVTRWAATTYEALARLATEAPESGVRMRWGTELSREPPGVPWWRDAVPDLRPLADPPAGFAGGWRLQVPVADTSTYLPWLAGRLEALGGTVSRAWLPSLPDRGVVVNATGLASRALAGDESLRPVRGQVVRLAQVGIDEWLLEQTDQSALTYVVPRERDVVVGGTAEEDVYDPAPDPGTADRILARARQLVPQLADAAVLGHRVGLRPARPAVRLETESRDGSTVIHCYGHGGSGITLSWGCAEDVAARVAQLEPARAG